MVRRALVLRGGLAYASNTFTPIRQTFFDYPLAYPRGFYY